jgi:predicted cobalt transporter CbtA
LPLSVAVAAGVQLLDYPADPVVVAVALVLLIKPAALDYPAKETTAATVGPQSVAVVVVAVLDHHQVKHYWMQKTQAV